jgi:hypothetical protein
MIRRMVLLTDRRGLRLWPLLRFLGLVPISILLGHDAVFVTQYGVGDELAEAMRAGGHDGYWIAFSLVILGLAALGLARSMWRGARLTRHARRLEVDAGRSGIPTAASGYVAEVTRIWPRLFVATAVGFTVMENLEHLAAGQAPHGMTSLIGAEHPFSIPVLAVVALAVAAVGGLLRWRIRILETRVALVAARLRWARPIASRPAGRWPSLAALRLLAWFLTRLDAGRAPPLTA